MEGLLKPIAAVLVNGMTAGEALNVLFDVRIILITATLLEIILQCIQHHLAVDNTDQFIVLCERENLALAYAPIICTFLVG